MSTPTVRTVALDDALVTLARTVGALHDAKPNARAAAREDVAEAAESVVAALAAGATREDRVALKALARTASAIRTLLREVDPISAQPAPDAAVALLAAVLPALHTLDVYLTNIWSSLQLQTSPIPRSGVTP